MHDAVPRTGAIGWVDLTVQDAAGIRDFYQKVVGWREDPVDMGGYDDWSMIPPGGEDPVAGICHARGTNANLPAAWLVYWVVEDLEASVRSVAEMGGEVVVAPRSLGGGSFAVIRDPAGAVSALYQTA
jgi:predicted enzyme related to lactoylglutathione lyase